MPLTKEEQIKRVALELKDGYYVNLGIGNCHLQLFIFTSHGNLENEGVDE